MKKLIALILTFSMMLSTVCVLSSCDVQGEQGAQGIQGEKGEQGIQGEKGDRGEQGAQGIQGEKGDRGEQGAQGIQGEKGDQGIQGEKGEQGIQGEKGDQGVQGEKGDQGESGRGIAKVELINGEVIVTYTDGTFENLGAIINDGTDGLEYYPLPDGTYGITAGTTIYLNNIVIPFAYNGKPVTHILPNAFADCPNLESITIPNGVTNIGEQAFYGCSGLKSVTIPGSVTSIGDMAFHNCDNIDTIIYKGTKSKASKLFTELNINSPKLAYITCSNGKFVLGSVSTKQAEYNTTTTIMPDNWNELTYQDNINTQIINYINSSFFDYDYKFENDQKYNTDGSINKYGIVIGAYTTNYSAATKLEDVTSLVDAKWGYTAAQKAEGGYAWKITLRDDLKWDDGTPIKAADFVYSMKQQLDPDFMNFRADIYYNTLRIKNSKDYFLQTQGGSYESLSSQGYKSAAEAIAKGVVIYVNAYAMWGADSSYVDENGNGCPGWLAYNDETVYTGIYNGEPDPVSGKMLWDAYGAAYCDVGGAYEAAVFVDSAVRNVKWEDVGIYSIDEENAIVICLDKSYSFLKEDGSLSYQAAQHIASLPLVHKEKYEASKIAPIDNSTPWTSNYNSSLATTASWGPYKLVEFVAGSHYKLDINENWYGWSMEQYNNQYNITAINCHKVEEWSDKWRGFLNGTYDDSSLATENIADYMYSKYVSYVPSTGTFGMQLYSNLPVLKASGNNNGILAIQEFRHAFSLALNRTDIVEKIWPATSTPCLGMINSEYYYDIENSASLDDNGVYRFTTAAKEGLLRAYGFVQAADGTWSSGTSLKGLSTDDAYDALTGYNPTLAKEKFQAAIEELTSNAEYYGYDATKDITIVYGSSVDNAKQRFRCDYLRGVLDELTKGTALEGKIKLVFDASAGTGWSDAFRSGKTQIGFGYGFEGNAFNPFDIIGAFVNPDDSLNYHTYWDTSSVNMTLTLPEGDYEGAGQTITMSIQNWYYCLNGLAADMKQPKTYNWDADYAPSSARLVILSALEEAALKECRSVMLIGSCSGSLLGAKFSQFSDNYNTFMGYGGFRYMEVNYTDDEWAQFVAANNNDLTEEYKKTE